MSINREYSDELRSDTVTIIIPIVTALAIIVPLFRLLIVVREPFDALWHLAAIPIVSLVTARLALRQLRQGEPLPGAQLFLGIHLLLLTLYLARSWQPGSTLPYIFLLFTIFASMLVRPMAGFYAWAVGTVLTLVGAMFTGQLALTNVLGLLSPVLLNLLVAVAMYLTALEWETAVESVNLLHRRARGRRDELFQMQQTLSQTNERLRFLNEQLDLARREAENERDIRTRFMNNVSHELRAPLNAIVNFAHIIMAGATGPVSDTQRDYLSRIERSGWNLLSLLNDLLDMAQIESGEFKLYLEDDDLHRVCADVQLSAEGLLLETEQVTFRTDYPDTWPTVHVDRSRIRQALINLISNAAKYTEAGSITLRVTADDEWVYLAVADTGVGIAPEHHEVIFQEFRQVDETAARKRIGTGLGLPISRHLVERHGGSLRLESAPGQGSTFTIALPRVRQTNPPPLSLPEAPQPDTVQPR